VIERFLDIADTLLIGGAMCFPFLQVQGHAVGDSMCEVEGLEPAQSALEKAAAARAALVLPSDLGLAERYAPDAPRRDIEDVEVPPGWMGLDIGPRTARLYARADRRRRHDLLERPDGRVRVRVLRIRHASRG